MWPWEHLAVGYVAVSLLVRYRGSRVTAGQAVAVGVGAAFPDLVDKPLAWAFDVLPSGTSLAHSFLVAIPLAAAVWAVAVRRDREPIGFAFAVSYLLHMPADALYGPLTGDDLSFRAFFWPVIVVAHETSAPGFAGSVAHYLRVYAAFLDSPHAAIYVGFELALLGSAAWLWVGDGRPPLPTVRRWIRGESGEA